MKTKIHRMPWIGAGACLALAVALLGVTWPKQGRIEELSLELEKLTPLLEQMSRHSETDPKSDGPGTVAAQLKAALPEEEEFLEFHSMVQKCAVDSGMGPIRYYSMDSPDYWPAKAGSEKASEGPIAVPHQYGENPGGRSNLRRYPLVLDFESDFASLLRFASRLQQLPRFCQIASLHLTGEGSKVKVLMRVEAYSILVTR